MFDQNEVQMGVSLAGGAVRGTSRGARLPENFRHDVCRLLIF